MGAAERWICQNAYPCQKIINSDRRDEFGGLAWGNLINLQNFVNFEDRPERLSPGVVSRSHSGPPRWGLPRGGYAKNAYPCRKIINSERSAARSAGAAGVGLPSNAGYLVSRGAIRSSRGCPGVDPGRLPYEARNDPGLHAKHFIHKNSPCRGRLAFERWLFFGGIEKSHDRSFSPGGGCHLLRT